jgi:archaellum component FlaC
MSSSSSSLATAASSSSSSSPSRSNNKHRRSLAISNGNNSINHESRLRGIIREREAQIDALQKEKTALTNEIHSLKRQYKASKKHHQQNASALTSTVATPKRKHVLSPYGNVVQESNTKTSLTHERSRMGRNASIATAKELSALTCPKEESRHNTNRNIVNRILAMFDDPASHIDYLNSIDFANDLRKLNSKIRKIFESEPRVAFLQSPVYVFGDIHGNFEDLHFFSDNIWRLGMSLTAGNFLFLGDYVDRGMSCLECIAYLFAMKLLMPHKVFLLRGNHETRDGKKYLTFKSF